MCYIPSCKLMLIDSLQTLIICLICKYLNKVFMVVIFFCIFSLYNQLFNMYNANVFTMVIISFMQ